MDNSTGCKLELSFDLEVVMSITNIPININIENFDDRYCQKKLQKYFNNHRGTNVSIKELKMNDLVCDAKNKLLNQLKSFKYHQWKNHRIYQLLRSAKELLKM